MKRHAFTINVERPTELPQSLKERCCLFGQARSHPPSSQFAFHTSIANVNNLHSASLPKYDMATTYEVTTRHKHGLHPERNSLAPILRLPTETLQAIFIRLAREYYHERTSCWTVPRWVDVSYVCRRWRDVALNCSTLWGYLFIVSPRWTEELLARSKHASLNVNVDFSLGAKFRASGFLDQVVKHAERIQELCIYLPFRGSVDDLSVLSSRAPRLTSLTIFGIDYDCHSELVWPPLLFDGDAPMLRTLTLMFCPISWDSLKVTGLTNLSLSHVPVQFRQNTTNLLATLKCMPNLVHLSLYEALSSAVGFLFSAAFKTFQKIVLPHLSYLRISAPISMVITLLHCLGIPLKTLVRLECTPERVLSFGDYAPLSSLLAQRFEAQAPSGLIVRSLNVASKWELVTLTFSLLGHACRVAASQTDILWDCNVPLKVTIHFDDSMTAGHWSDIASDICCSLPPTDVQSVSVSQPPVSSAFWERTLGHLRDIRYLKLEKGLMPDLVPLLSVDDGENWDGHAGPSPHGACAPALEKLVLCSLFFEHPTPPSTNVASYSTDVQSLCDTLSRHKESKGELVIDHCFVTKDRTIEFNMVGRWEDGHFHVAEEYTTDPRLGTQSDSQDSEDSEGSEDSELGEESEDMGESISESSEDD